MRTQLQERLKEIAKECGGNRALCEKSGISERTFANWLAGSSEPKVIGISAIAQAAGVTIDWLVTGAKPKHQLGARKENETQTLNIAWAEKTLATGKGPVDTRLNVADFVPFSRTFLTEKLARKSLEQLCVFDVSGDSMEPTMNDGDLVLVDWSITGIQDGLMAYAFQGSIFIKRIVHRLEGIEVISDNNTLYPAHRIEGDDIHKLEFIGPVIWIGKAL